MLTSRKQQSISNISNITNRQYQIINWAGILLSYWWKFCFCVIIRGVYKS